MPDTILAGSQDAEDALAEIVKPLVGAATPSAQSTSELHHKYYGVAPAGFTESTFPTQQ